ncbi:methylmalonyl-CoA epimerase [Reichenbachiella sp. MALMAid0571]|uniref:methylmalonyl-CoA epimerase n=1 Tax=Reichenbachiella sp. MALMAid0571 TaxID=3143939 RepID=UPI0032DE5952
MKLEHVGIAVSHLGMSNELFARLLGRENYKTEKVDSEHVITSFFKSGATKIELLESNDEDSAIAKFIKKKGEGVHHLAFNVEDIHVEMKRLSDLGFELLNTEPKKGADNKLICFLHPKSTNGVLIELCQDLKN